MLSILLIEVPAHTPEQVGCGHACIAALATVSLLQCSFVTSADQER